LKIIILLLNTHYSPFTIHYYYSDIVIAAVDATVATGVAGKNDIKGYPTIKFFPKGSTTAEDYNGGRTAPDIIK
jgi:protein disulfide-isomerase A6